MSEYWKSTPKYWCKHCTIYVKDTPFERKQHESTGKHQGNLRRFLRGIQNDHERGERDKQKAKDEIERLNRVVGGSSTAPAATAATTSQAPSRKVPKPGLTAVDQKRQWAQLAEMGIAVPEGFRGEMAMPGDWQTTAETVIEDTKPDDTLNRGIRKRKLDDDDLEEEIGKDSSSRRLGWGSSIKKYPGKPPDEDEGLDSLLSGSRLKQERDSFDEAKTDETKPSVISASDSSTEASGQLTNSNHNPSKKRIDGEDGTEQVVKQEIVDDTTGRLLTSSVEAMNTPVFKKRKARAR